MTKRRVWIGIAILILIALLTPRFTLPHAKAEVLRSLQASLGRRIQAQSVHLQLLPLPGIVLDRVRVAEDPAFGLEDMVMADSASASVSLWQLLHGHLVFSRIHLQSPSINLVRNRHGEWNIVALLNSARGARPGRGRGARQGAPARFPYVDWSQARINFKFRQTKTRFFLDQVHGSLAREHSYWRLQVSFVPARSDLNVSDTGEVTLDGRWRAPAASLDTTPFVLAVHLRNSYLAGSSALLFGHDAGVHGVLNAAMRLSGTGRQFSITGTATARSLRRWDLLPPPAQVSCTFAAVYRPSQDQLQIQDVGDAGWRHLRVTGVINNLFSHPDADLHLQLHDFAAAGLLPLALALKSNLPANLAAAGRVDGQAQLQWQLGEALPGGSAQFQFRGLGLTSGGDTLEMPRAEMSWDSHRLQLDDAPGLLKVSGAQPVRLRFGGELDRRGFALDWSSAAVNGAATAALTRLLGLGSPRPPQLHGRAQVRLRLVAGWAGLGQPRWQGEARFPQARFQPSGSSGVELRDLDVRLGSGGAAVEARFQLARLPLEGSLAWKPDGLIRFALRGQRLRSAVLWELLYPASGDLMQRVFGSMLGAPAAPAWLRHLHADGDVEIQHLDWHGIATRLRLQLQIAPGSWQATRLDLGLEGGQFRGQGRLSQGRYAVSGSVAAAQPVLLLPLLAPTAYAGLLTGMLSGTVTLSRPASQANLRHLDAEGSWEIRDGRLETEHGGWGFQSCGGRLALQQGEAIISALHCLAGGRRYRGQAAVRFPSAGRVSYVVDLRSGTRRLHLLSPQPRP
ncbi:MAG: AsmA family protein [Terriglobales bacterium]